MTEFVLDASITVAWLLDDESSDPAETVFIQLMAGRAYVPTIWPREVANALLVAERKGRVTDLQTSRLIATLDTLDIVVVRTERSVVFSDVMLLARQLGLTTYDAEYLALAMRLGLPLSGLDSRLLAAAGAVGVEVFDC